MPRMPRVRDGLRIGIISGRTSISQGNYVSKTKGILSLHFASMRSVSKPALYIDCICKQYATPCDFTWRKSGTVSRFRALIKPQSERNKCTRNYVALLVLHRDIYFTPIFLWTGIYVNNNLSSRALSSLYISRGLRISIRKNRRGKIAPSKA